MTSRFRWCVAIFAVALVAALPCVADSDGTGAILESLQTARRNAGLPPLVRRARLDAVARTRATLVAALPHDRRLAVSQPLGEMIRQAGVKWVRVAHEHLDLKRGHADPVTAFISSWYQYDTAWSKVIDPANRSIGMARVRAGDGWEVLVSVLVEELEVPSDLKGLERQAYRAVNDVRRRRGLAELTYNERLAEIARSHSRDMARRMYFGHQSPEGHEAADRLLSGGVGYRRVGENLASNRGAIDPVGTAVDSWMGSPAHRANILEADYRETGLGVAIDEEGSVIFTQLFLNPRTP